MRIVVRAPNHLGDGIMARDVVYTLGQRHQVAVFGPRWLPTIYHDLGVSFATLEQVAGDRWDVGVTLSPSMRSAWQIRRSHRVIGWPTDNRRLLLTDVVNHRTHVHRRQSYADLLAPLGLELLPSPVLKPPSNSLDVLVPKDHLAICPASRSGAIRQWTGFDALLSARSPVVYSGPGEGWVRHRFHDAVHRHNLPLGALMKAFGSARQVVGNDSGLMHVASAMGRPTLVVFGSTDPQITGPRGCQAVVGGADLSCAPCRRQRCAVKPAFGCMQAPVEDVLPWVVS